MKKLITILAALALTSTAFAGKTVILDGLIDADKQFGLAGVLELYCDSEDQADAIEQSFGRYKLRVSANSETNEVHPLAYRHNNGSIIIRDTTDSRANTACKTNGVWCYTIPNGNCSWTKYMK